MQVIASAKSWIVGEALTQLERVAQLPGVMLAVGMPDIHPGRGVPIGAAVATRGILYPHLAGNDIGCGMALWQTDLLARKVKLDRWIRKLRSLEDGRDDVVSRLPTDAEMEPSKFDGALGTVGGGNHFAELQAIDEVRDAPALAALGLSRDRLLLLVHSGSRGFGDSVLQEHLDRCGTSGLADDSGDARQYLSRHDQAVRWAARNRRLIAGRLAELLGASAQPVLDLCHNSITTKELGGAACWLHRKGAAPSDAGPVVIPGSRGSHSYLVAPKGSPEASGFSVAHGAGRKWTRSDARGRLEHRYSPEDLGRTELGGRVICDDKSLLYEEAPQAYKSIDVVIDDLIEARLVDVIATMRPLITYKTSSHMS